VERAVDESVEPRRGARGDFLVSWTWLVFVEVFMALIVYPAMASQ
jgi:hypothetical protein